MNAEIESMMAAAQASAEEGVEEADVSQEEMAGRSVGRGRITVVKCVHIAGSPRIWLKSTAPSGTAGASLPLTSKLVTAFQGGF